MNVYFVTIQNKRVENILPLILNYVITVITIYTIKQRIIRMFKYLVYLHLTVCHKNNFVNLLNGVNTQAIESFIDYIKYKIKRLGRVEPLGLRESFFSFFSF